MEIRHIAALLDNSQDAETIALEVYNNATLSSILDELNHDWDAPMGQENIGLLIRELWDIAYNHGYYDGKTEAEEDIV